MCLVLKVIPYPDMLYGMVMRLKRTITHSSIIEFVCLKTIWGETFVPSFYKARYSRQLIVRDWILGSIQEFPNLVTQINLFIRAS